MINLQEWSAITGIPVNPLIAPFSPAPLVYLVVDFDGLFYTVKLMALRPIILLIAGTEQDLAKTLYVLGVGVTYGKEFSKVEPTFSAN